MSTLELLPMDVYHEPLGKKGKTSKIETDQRLVNTIVKQAGKRLAEGATSAKQNVNKVTTNPNH